jgi:hypothetical protein
MAHTKDYIPSNDADFNNFFKYLNQYVAQKCSGATPEWTHIPQAARTVMADSYIAWYTAYANTLKPHSKVETEAKNDAKKASAADIRPFVNQYLRYPPVTNEDRTAMGIPNRDTVRTPVPVPATFPEFSVEVKAIRRLDIHFREQGSEGKAKPYGYDGAVIFWATRDTPPATPEELTKSELATRTPHTLIFDETLRGKTVYIALRWQNEKGQKGPWSDVKTALVP